MSLDPDRPLALAGFMGVGKSSVGRRVAIRLTRPFFDSDELVVARLGRPIAELFAEGNERLFREEEAAVIKELVERRPAAVIALGGGALERDETKALLVEKTLLVHLSQPWEKIRPVLSHLAVGRPLLATASEEEIHALYLARQHSYGAAHITVSTSRRGTARACRDVLIAIGESAPP